MNIKIINHQKLLFLLFLLFVSSALFAQSVRVSGLVTDSKGNPISGVTVSIKEHPKGTMTDSAGQYHIDAEPGNTLVFIHVGNVTEQRVLKADEHIINLHMIQSAADLGDVVVVGYNQQKKENVVASISTITAKELSVTGRSLSNSLAGNLPGIIAIQPSGEPGYDNSNFWIRGVSSFAGGTNPLIIIDGIPRSASDMSNIPVEDIETFSVLKDAAATSVYGAEGANGVVLVTTKRGLPSKTVITGDLQHAIRTPIRLPHSLDAYRTLSLYNEAEWNEKGNPLVGYMPTYDDATLEKYRTGADPDLYPNVNWLDLLKPHTQASRYTVNFRGGGDRVRFFTSGAYYAEDGLYNSHTVENYNANLKYERFNLRSNIDMDLTSTTKMSVDLAGIFVKQNAPITTADNLWSIISLAPRYLFPMVYSDGTFSEHPVYSAGSVGTAERANPYNMLNNMGYSRNQTVTLQSKVNLSQKLDAITKGLSWRGAVGFDNLSQGSVNRTKQAAAYYATGRDVDGNLIYNQILAGAALSNPVSGGSSGERNTYIETAFEYKRLFGTKHDVTGIVLYNQKEKQYQNRGNGLEMLPYRNQSVVASGTYGYDGRYLLQASMGMTGSENFPSNHRWGLFPSIGTAWWASHEKFWQPLLKVVNKLKVRASYGKTGNDVLADDLGRFPYRAQLNDGAPGYNYSWTGGAGVANNGQGSGGPGAGIIEGDYATPALKWEVEDKFNTGIDLGLFDSHIEATVDYFYNKRHDILMRRNTLPTAAGLRVAPMQNFGRVNNSGIDLDVTGTQKINEVTLGLRVNYTYTKNKIIEYDEIPQSYAYQAYTGQSIGQPLIYIANGLYTPDDFNITTAANGAQTYQLKGGLPDPGFAVAPGDIKYKDLNGDGVIDNYDQTYDNGFYSANTPGIVYGFGLTAAWKGFNISVFFQGAGHFSTYLLNKAENFFPFQRAITDEALRTEAMDRWTYSDPYNQNVLFPRLSTANNGNNTRASTWWYRDASYLRFKNFEFGYDVNPNWVKHLKLNGIRLYVQGENLHTWDKVKFWDPEETNRSGSRYPISSTWTFGMNVNF